MRRVAVVTAVLLSACASSQRPASAPQPDQTLRIPTNNASGGSTITMAQTESPSQRTVAAPAARIWNALPGVYETLGLPITDRNNEARTLGTTSYKIRRKLGNTPLSRYLDCGSTQGSSSADSYEVLLSVTTQLLPTSADTTAVSTTVSAMARPVFVSGEYINCGSTRALEKRFFDVLDVALRP
jgi:hypothetical protein